MRHRLNILALILVIGWSFPALGEEESKPKRNFVCRPHIYQRLVKAQKALQENRYKEGEEAAKALQSRLRLNDHERALVLQTLGYIYAGQERLKLAVKTLQETYELDALPEPTQNAMLFNIGQLNMATRNYKGAVKAFEEWLKRDGADAKPSALYTIGAAYYQTKNYRKAIQIGERAFRESKGNPKDSLLQLLLSSYVELKQYKNSVRIISILVERYPEKKNNWIQLAAMYSQLGDDKRALAVMELAYRAGVLDKTSDYMQLSQRLLAEENPFEAGKVLEKGLQEAKIERNPKTTRLLSTAWLQSRNVDRARPALDEAAKMADDGDLYMRLAQLELESERWEAAVTASRKALRKGLEDPGESHLLIGIAEMRSGSPGKAKEAFEQASKTPKSRKAAESWLKFLETSQAARSR